MIIRTLTPALSVADQLVESDLPQLLESEFKSVVCNRPDEEGEPHLTQDRVKRALNEAGIAFRYLPVNGANITEADIAAQSELLRELPQPVLAYCRTGTRCTKLWALDPANPIEPSERINAAANAGLDIRDIAPRLG